MKLSIIIVSWNVRDDLLSCIKSIKQEIGLSPSEYEIVVVDNASSDNSDEYVRKLFPEIDLICNDENIGFGSANNQALGRCHGQFIFLLNPDTVVTGHAIDRMLSIMTSEKNIGILGCRLLNTDGSFQRASGGSILSLTNLACHYLLINSILPANWGPPPLFLVDDPQGTFDIGWVSGAAMMISRAAIQDYLFNETFFMYAEDIELCDRIRMARWRVVYTSKASIIHHHRRSISKQASLKISSWALKGPRCYFMKKHGRLATTFFDLILLTGFTLRWLTYETMTIFTGQSHYSDLAANSRKNALISLKMIFSLT